MKIIKRNTYLIKPTIFLLFCFFCFSQVGFTQSNASKLQVILAEKMKFSSDDFTKLKQGKLVAKLLKTQDKREVAVFGIININTPLDSTLKTFQETMARQNKSSIIEFGDFSDPPNFNDINNLSLEKVDIQDLKKCQLKNCALKLSEEMIDRFQKEIDWNTSDHTEKASRIFWEMILQYIKTYLSKGETALIEYDNDQRTIRLQEEHQDLLSNLFWINDFAPEFSEYLKNFPRKELSNVRRSLNWSKLKFGLKPFITITQTFTFTNEKEGISQIVSVSKQLYASRYFDSSLGLTALVRFQGDSGNTESYLIYTNHSRSSSLDGMFSQFKRNIVEREAIEKLKPLLENTKIYAEAKLNGQNETQYNSNESTVKQWFLDIRILVGICAAILILVFLMLIGRKFSNK